MIAIAMPDAASSPLDRRPLLIGMVHLGPTPGSPQYHRTTATEWRNRALADVVSLQDAGFDAVLIENYRDAPFFAGRVPAETVAAMAHHAGLAVDVTDPSAVAVGVNVLRNDGESALAIAAAINARFVRVNVLQGAYVTDQGVIEGRAADVLRARERLAPDVRIFADLRVKHAGPLVERPLEEEARELVERAGADAVIVSGAGTGLPVDPAELATVRGAIGAHPLLVGSGATADTIAALLEHADGVIVGTAIKRDGVTTAPVDAERAKAFVRAARSR